MKNESKLIILYKTRSHIGKLAAAAEHVTYIKRSRLLSFFFFIRAYLRGVVGHLRVQCVCLCYINVSFFFIFNFFAMSIEKPLSPVDARARVEKYVYAFSFATKKNILFVFLESHAVKI